MEDGKKGRKLKKAFIMTVLCAASAAAAFSCVKVRRELYRGWEAGKDYTGAWHASVFGQEDDWYLVDGRVAATESGVLQDGGDGYCLVERGRISTSYTGVFRDGDGTLWYLIDGRTEGVSGFLEDGGTWYLADGGLVAEDLTGLFSGVIDGAEGGWYVHGGRVSAGRTGFVEDDGSWKYVSHGLYDGTLSGIRRGVVDGEDALWYVGDGVARTDLSGFVGTDAGWLYVRNGKYDGGLCAVLKGTVDGEGGTWYVRDGKAQTDFTGFAEWNGGYVYIEDGKADFSLTGVRSGKIDGKDGSWYVTDGMAALSFSGTVTAGGVRYDVNDGKTEKAAARVSSGSSGSSAASAQSAWSPGNVVTTGYPGGAAGGSYIGRLRIPSVGISVGLYHCYAFDATANQAITDRKDSACYLWGKGCWASAVGDHNTQAFSALKNVKTGSYMYISAGSTDYRYKCAAAGNGYTDGMYVYTDGGTCLDTAYQASAVYCYTCRTWPKIRYAVFLPG